ncbi:hypothetical protein MCP1_7030001 [Candidatus Terasakiella magnetica]|nr:hypothetical protein MCP1_7030001 [Candidatus Terasakiella magnetica]
MTEIQSSHAGETSPQVATEDGMRERMNRRVEVTISNDNQPVKPRSSMAN